MITGLNAAERKIPVSVGLFYNAVLTAEMKSDIVR
jgi:hypothetical protein